MTETELERWRAQQRRLAAARAAAPAVKKPQGQVVLKRVSSSARVGGTGSARTRPSVRIDPPTSGVSRLEATAEAVPASPPVVKSGPVEIGPPCLICGKPIERPPGTNGRPRKVHEGDCQTLRDAKIREAFAPEPKRVPVAIAVTTAAPGPEKPRQFLKQCTVVDGYSGQRCGLLAPHDSYPHRTARGEFHQVLGEGAVPTLVRELVTASGTQRENALGVEKKSNAQEVRESRARRKVTQ